MFTECCTLEQNKTGYIYITTNNVNGKQYIGKRTKPYFDEKYLGSGKLLRRAINKYGPENFHSEILEWCYSIEELNEAERKWIRYFSAQTDQNFYNISEGGDWGDISKGMSPSERISWGQKISKANTGKKRTEEQRHNISVSLSGKKKPMSKEAAMRRCGAGNHRYGKHWSNDERKMLSEHSVTKKNVCVEMNGEKLLFQSIVECSRYLKEKYGISKYLVKKMLKENKPYKLNGCCKEQDKVRKVEGMVIRYI